MMRKKAKGGEIKLLRVIDELQGMIGKAEGFH